MVSFKFWQKLFKGKGLERQGPRSGRRARSKALRTQRLPKDKRLAVLPIPLFICLALWVICVAALLYRNPRSNYEFVLNQRVPENLFALVDFEYVDPDETELKRTAEARKVPNFYRLNEETIEEDRRAFNALFSHLAATPETPAVLEPRQQALVRDRFGMVLQRLPANELAVLKAIAISTDIQRAFRGALSRVLQGGILSREEQQPNIDRYLDESQIVVIDSKGRRFKTTLNKIQTPQEAARQLMESLETNLPSALRNKLADDIVSSGISANLVYEKAITEEEKERVRQSVPVVRKWVARGEVFLEKGHLVRRLDLTKLQAYQHTLNQSSTDEDLFSNRLMPLVLSLLVIITGALYFNSVHASLVANQSSIILVGLTLGMNLIFVCGLEEILLYFLNGSLVFLYPALPLAITPMLLTLLFDQKVGISSGLVLTLLAALLGKDAMHVITVGMCTSCAAVYSVRYARTRLKTFRSVLYIALAIFLVETVYLLLKQTPMPNYFITLGVATVNALVCLMIVNLLLPLAEYIFGITTDITLLELSDLNHPLLRRLQMEAPGTHQHTMIVAILAEQAADAIGANPLLARVAAYYHDIGKLANPMYFTENNPGYNRHEELKPRMSALVILNHIKEGLQLAAEYKLRKPIRDAIATHQGTSLIYFFYKRAQELEAESGNGVNEDAFRYPGPLPVTKESTIISLVDSCEAASRSLEKPTPQKIDSMVHEIIRGKMADGQLDHSELTLQEINIIAETVIKALQSVLHTRIAYPKPDSHENSGKRTDGRTSGKKQDKVDSAVAESRDAEPPEKES